MAKVVDRKSLKAATGGQYSLKSSGNFGGASDMGGGKGAIMSGRKLKKGPPKEEFKPKPTTEKVGVSIAATIKDALHAGEKPKKEQV